MKIMTVLGTRPEVIRLSLIIKKLDRYCRHILVHTGQNFASCLNDIFFKELDLRKPNYYLGVKADTFAEQIGKILIEAEKVFLKEKPDRILILGDTNSGLVSVVAKRMQIPVYHMEAGNRCYDNRVPEEVNRVVIDHSSNILMPYTHRSKENLLREGMHNKNIYVIGNPIYEVIKSREEQIAKSDILKKLRLEKSTYFLATMHREENVDDKERLKSIITALQLMQKKYKIPIICSLHPRTKKRMQKYGLKNKNDEIKFLTPLGFFDFISLEKQAFCVLSDSGTVQEECCIFKVSNITIRDVTERPETVACGSNILAGVDSQKILKSVEIVTNESNSWNVPEEYLRKNVSTVVIKILLEKK
jgi:UDP-N-acetylglucosamine 2-epimerase (non-hydrolysing)